MANGIVIIDKPAGWTSQDVTAKLRGVFHQKRIGHGGTLDPMATGVLPVFVGRATRAVEFFEHANKEYIAGLRLGVRTDTEDTTGNVLQQQPVCVTESQLQQVLHRFTGRQSQLPPMYSAVKIGGKKLYELARAGKTVERAPRTVTVFSLELLSGSGADWTFRVHCSKGTYVRTLCADIGDALGCGGCMSSLRRTRAGGYTLDQAVCLDGLIRQPDPEACLLPVDSLFSDRPACHVSAGQEQRLRNGADVRIPGLRPGEYRVYSPQGEFLLLGRWEDGTLTTVKSFFEVN